MVARSDIYLKFFLGLECMPLFFQFLQYFDYIFISLFDHDFLLSIFENHIFSLFELVHVSYHMLYSKFYMQCCFSYYLTYKHVFYIKADVFKCLIARKDCRWHILILYFHLQMEYLHFNQYGQKFRELSYIIYPFDHQFLIDCYFSLKILPGN